MTCNNEIDDLNDTASFDDTDNFLLLKNSGVLELGTYLMLKNAIQVFINASISTKLNTDGGTRTGLTDDSIITINSDGVETLLPIGSEGTVLMVDGGEVDFHNIPEQKVYHKTTSDVDMLNDFGIFSDTSNSNNNKKDKIINITRGFGITPGSIKMNNHGTVQTTKGYYSIFQEITLGREIGDGGVIKTLLSCRSSLDTYTAYSRVEVVRDTVAQQTITLTNSTTSWNYNLNVQLDVLPGDILRYSIKGIGNSGHIAYAQRGSIYYDIVKNGPDSIANSNQNYTVS